MLRGVLFFNNGPALTVKPSVNGLSLCQSSQQVIPVPLVALQDVTTQLMARIANFVTKTRQECIELDSSPNPPAEPDTMVYVIPEFSCMETIEQQLQYFSHTIRFLDTDSSTMESFDDEPFSLQGFWQSYPPYFFYNSEVSYDCQGMMSLVASSGGDDGDDETFFDILPGHYAELSEEELIRLLRITLHLLRVWGVSSSDWISAQLFELACRDAGLKLTKKQPQRSALFSRADNSQNSVRGSHSLSIRSARLRAKGIRSRGFHGWRRVLKHRTRRSRVFRFIFY